MLFLALHDDVYYGAPLMMHSHSLYSLVARTAASITLYTWPPEKHGRSLGHSFFQSIFHLLLLLNRYLFIYYFFSSSGSLSTNINQMNIDFIWSARISHLFAFDVIFYCTNAFCNFRPCALISRQTGFETGENRNGIGHCTNKVYTNHFSGDVLQSTLWAINLVHGSAEMILRVPI